MSNTVTVWKPNSQWPGASGLAVPYNGQPEKMSRSLYESLLRNRLSQLINQNPKAALRLLQTAAENNPDLREAAQSDPRQTPDLIMSSGQMEICLNRIDWKSGQLLNLQENQLPSLAAIIEALP